MSYRAHMTMGKIQQDASAKDNVQARKGQSEAQCPKLQDTHHVLLTHTIELYSASPSIAHYLQDVKLSGQ
jgi:hypothetical protein